MFTTTYKSFEDGSQLSITTNDGSSSFKPFIVNDATPSRIERRKRPKGPTMTPRHVRSNKYEYPSSYLVNHVFTQGFRKREGWHYTQVCPGSVNTTTIHPSYWYTNTIKKDDCLGNGGIGSQYLYHEALRLVAEDRVPVNITNYRDFGLPHFGLKSSDNITLANYRELIPDLQRDVVSETFKAYDAATEFAERTKTLQTVADVLKGCVSPLKTLKSLGKRFKSNPGTTLADIGLQYEYAIRPILYSMEEINKILNDHNKFTIRKTRSKSILFSTDSQVPTSGLRSYDRGSVVVRLRAGSYFHYENEFDRVTGSVRINPITTAWELIPYSFIIDWFVGIGDWLVFQTASLSQIGARALFYVSVREVGSYESVLENDGLRIPEYRTSASYNDVWSDNTCFAGGLTIKGAGPVNLESTRIIPSEHFPGSSAVYKKTTLNSYERVLFAPSDLPIEVNGIFELSKRRLLDAVMLLSVRLKS